MPEPANHDRPFYVGYLPLPPVILRFLLPWLAGNLVLLAAVAVLLASQQRDPGDGVWDTSNHVTVEGLVLIDPYPRLVVDTKDGSGSAQTWLLVEQGKVGTQERFKNDHGSILTLTGYVIERHGVQMLELDPDATMGYTASNRVEANDLPQPQDLGRHELVGEIVDPKCYLGVMKPGDGKPHKVCATLCITGGVPPMFVVRDEAGQTTAYLLTGPGGEVMPAELYEYIADPVRVTGQVLRREGQLVLRADWTTLVRLE